MSDLVRKYFKELLGKYNAGTATEKEKEFLASFYDTFDAQDEYVTEDNATAHTDLKEQIKRNIDARIDAQNGKPGTGGAKVKRLLVRYTAAAAVILVAFVGGYFVIKGHLHDKDQLMANKIVPGSNRALLKLANGKVIDLTNAHNGVIANGTNIKISKTASGQLVYTISGADNAIGSNEKNTITTPNGGQYQVVLPDGTVAMLNAASSLTYPVAFAGNERVVELIGEAYFEVAHNKHVPFKVKSADQTVTVLGTHFNINAYTDESGSKTTLLEGSVSVSSTNGHELLVPGQQSIVSSGGIEKRAADTEKEVAWKNGVFSFDGDDLGTVMRQVARWYDVKVEFDKGLIDNKFYGEISRSSSLNDVIKILELSNVKFSVNGRKITVTAAQ